MPLLNLAIGKSKYVINCEKGEEDKVLELAAKLNERVNNMSLSLRGADEKTILMLSALAIEDELEAVKNGDVNSKPIPKKEVDKKDVDKIVEEKVIAEIGEVTERIINLTKKIEEL